MGRRLRHRLPMEMASGWAAFLFFRWWANLRRSRMVMERMTLKLRAINTPGNQRYRRNSGMSRTTERPRRANTKTDSIRMIVTRQAASESYQGTMAFRKSGFSSICTTGYPGCFSGSRKGTLPVKVKGKFRRPRPGTA